MAGDRVPYTLTQSLWARNSPQEVLREATGHLKELTLQSRQCVWPASPRPDPSSAPAAALCSPYPGSNPPPLLLIKTHLGNPLGRSPHPTVTSQHPGAHPTAEMLFFMKLVSPGPAVSSPRGQFFKAQSLPTVPFAMLWPDTVLRNLCKERMNGPRAGSVVYHMAEAAPGSIPSTRTKDK